jgi:iron(III) transport system permease protein
MLACFTPLLLGFLLPAGLLLRMAVGEGDAQFGERFLMLARNSLTLSGLTALLAVALAVLLAYSARLSKTLLAQGSTGWSASATRCPAR